MSAANPSYDIEALHRAQRAYEPSMEEILASIRNIISEERPGVGSQPNAVQPRPAPASESAQPPVPVTDRREPTERAEPVAMPRVVWPKPEVEAPESDPAPTEASAPAPAAQPAQEQIPGEHLLSAEANAAIAHSFDALSLSVALQNSTLIEDAVRDLIRPMLKAWLDDHLPTMVENLVRAEIQRVARGGR